MLEGARRRWRELLAGLLLLGSLGGLAFWLRPQPAPPLAVLTPTPRPTASPAPPLTVHVTGAVAGPGVYRLPPGSRAEQAVAEAGGFTEEADPSSLNLAAPLVDGQQVVVRSRLRTPAAAEPAAAAGGLTQPGPGAKLNLNQASAADLDQLPGIGAVLAQRIVERRQRLGPFRSIEQLRDEKLVPAATFERIKDLITVD